VKYNDILEWIKRFLAEKNNGVSSSFRLSEENEPQKQIEKKGYFFPPEVEGRVHNIYPKDGAYRFPVLVEQEANEMIKRGKTRKPKESHLRLVSQSVQATPSVQASSTGKESYFKGDLRKSNDIPSPIYGFAQRNKPHVSLVEDHYPEEKYIEEKYIEENVIESEEIYTEENAFESVKEIQQEETSLDIEPIQEVAVTTSILPFNHRMEPKQEDVLIQRASAIKEDSGLHNGVEYSYPDVSILQRINTQDHVDDAWVEQQAESLMETFQHFHLKAELIGVTQGPAVTRFEIQPAPGIKISKFVNLQDDLKLSLAAKEIRIEAPIPGKNAIGIEVPNPSPKPVFLGDILASDAFQIAESPLTICLGSDLSGEPVITDIQKMPHGLIAGATGSGKSVCINSLLVSLLYKASPEQLRLLLIDPKVVELTPYQSIPHLVTPVVTDPKRATASLKWAVDEMERRYQLFATEGVRDLGRYNKVMEEATGEAYTLPYIVIIIDELADLMMVSPQDVEDAICRITQKARACGIHLIVATQRPSVDVITGLIKANIPTRLAFSVSSQVDSRTILDMSGAERLLGKGDMLFLQNGASKPIRVQGNFVSDEEIEQIILEVSKRDSQHFLFTQEELVTTMQDPEMQDELLEEVAFFVMEQGVASASSLQRKFRIGYNRAARLIDWMEEQGIVSESLGSKPRNVIWTQEQFLEWLDSHS